MAGDIDQHHRLRHAGTVRARASPAEEAGNLLGHGRRPQWTTRWRWPSALEVLAIRCAIAVAVGAPTGLIALLPCDDHTKGLDRIKRSSQSDRFSTYSIIEGDTLVIGLVVAPLTCHKP